MNVSNDYCTNIPLTLPQEIYYLFLKTINGISFTQREIDIIACVLSGRTTKKIASFLLLSPKTVENHIRNIRLKLKCESHKNLVDFIEKSDKFVLIKKYYSNLIVQNKFECELNKIGQMASVYKENLSCLIVHNKEQKDKMVFIHQLKNHLSLIGFKVLNEIKEEHNISTWFHGRTQFQKINCTIYILPDSSIKELEHNINIEFSKLEEEDNRKSKSIIFLLSANDHPIVIPEQLNHVVYLNLLKEGNYYFLVFKILKMLLPNINLDKNILEFKKQCEKFCDPYSLKVETKENPILDKDHEGILFLNILKNIKWKILFSRPALLTTFLVIFFVFANVKLPNSPSPDANQKNLNLTSNSEAKGICKVPSPCDFFSGRIDFIDKIKNYLNQDKKIVIAGYQGMGKTQVSYQYAKQNINDYKGGTYIFKADSEQSLINSIRAFSITMGIVTKQEAYRLNDDQIKKLILPLLQGDLEKQKRMLLIFDNVDNYDTIKDLISIQSGKHHVIITSNSKKWDAWNVLELKEFDKEKQEAESLVLKVLKKETQQDAQKLAKKLGYYPLAVAQAINYLKNNEMITIEDYIREYDSLYDRRKAFLNYHSFEQNHYIKTSLAAFEISKKILVKESKDAYYLLKLCSYFSRDIIPISIFKNDIKNISNVLEILNKYSILDVININGELFLNMHNVLRDSLKIQIHEEKEEGLIEEKILRLIDEYFVYDFWNKQNIEKIRLIIPHVEYFLNYLHKKNSPLLKTLESINILSKAGGYHIHCFRDTSESIRLLEKAKYFAQFIDSEQRNLTNRIMEDLATSYYYNGEYNKARQEIELVKKRNGASELSFLIEGHILYNECKYDEAQIAYEKVLKLLKDEKNLQYLALTNRSLGLVFYRKSQFFQADKSEQFIRLSKEYLEKALEIQESFNSENLELAITKHAYARTAVKLREFDKAGHYFSNALRIAKDYCKKDEDHYEILVMKRSYGHYLCLYDKSRFKEGVQNLKEALEGKLRIYKNKPHQAIIGTMELIVEVYSLNPKNKELIKLMPTINQYLDDWALSEKLDHSKNINNQLIGERIRSMKNVINKITSEKKITV